MNKKRVCIIDATGHISSPVMLSDQQFKEVAEQQQKEGNTKSGIYILKSFENHFNNWSTKDFENLYIRFIEIE